MTDAIDIIVGRNIRFHRRLRGWSQGWLSLKTNIKCRQIQRYERGMDSLPPSGLKLFAEIFGCYIHNFFFDGMTFPDAHDITTPGRLESAKIKSIIRSFLAIRSPVLQDHACAIMHSLAITQEWRQ